MDRRWLSHNHISLTFMALIGWNHTNSIFFLLFIVTICRLGSVVVSVHATGLVGCRFEPGQGDGFLRAIKIRGAPSSWVGSKAGRSHVVRFYGM
jgi:hypothetical protein